MVKPPNTEKREEKNDTSYRGIRKRKWGKWVSEIRLPNSRQRIWLGSYDSAEKAARAFDAATFCLRGHNARFNFPDNPPNIDGGRSMTPSQIQAAAARFANSGRPDESQMEFFSSEGTMVLKTESPSPSSISEGTVQTDSDFTLPDLFAPIESSDYSSGYGIFPGFDDFYVPDMHNINVSSNYGEQNNNINYGEEEENMDGFIIDDSFLWNF